MTGVTMSVATTRVSNTARKLEARLRGQVGKAIADFGLIEDGDRPERPEPR